LFLFTKYPCFNFLFRISATTVVHANAPTMVDTYVDVLLVTQDKIVHR